MKQKSALSPILRAGGIAAGAAAVAGAMSVSCVVLLSNYLGQLAFRRKPPRFRLRVSGGPRKKPEYESAKAHAEALKAIEDTHMEPIDRTADDGTRLHARLYLTDHPKRILICMHGWRSYYAHDFGESTSFYRENGSILLFPDQRAQGQSEGDRIGFGTIERKDCLLWANYLTERFGDRYPIYLCGISLGASTVLMAADLPLPKTVKGILADCGFTSPRAVFQHVLRDNLHIRGALADRVIDRAIRKNLPEDARSLSTVTALQHARVPVLLVHGTADTFVPIDMTYENYLACSSPCELLIVPGATHGISYLIDRPKYQKTVLSFFEKYDGAPSEEPAAASAGGALWTS